MVTTIFPRHCSCGGDRCGRRGCHGGCHGGRSRGGRSGRFIAAELAGGFRHTAATAAVHVAGGAQRHLVKLVKLVIGTGWAQLLVYNLHEYYSYIYHIPYLSHL